MIFFNQFACFKEVPTIRFESFDGHLFMTLGEKESCVVSCDCYTPTFWGSSSYEAWCKDKNTSWEWILFFFFKGGYFPYNFWHRPYKFLTKKNEKKKKENICHLLFKGTTFKGNFLGSSHHQHGEENNWWGLNPGGQQKSIFLSRLINCDMRRYLAQLYWGTVSWYCENMCICISISNYKSKERGFYLFIYFLVFYHYT